MKMPNSRMVRGSDLLLSARLRAVARLLLIHDAILKKAIQVVIQFHALLSAIIDISGAMRQGF